MKIREKIEKKYLNENEIFTKANCMESIICIKYFEKKKIVYCLQNENNIKILNENQSVIGEEDAIFSWKFWRYIFRYFTSHRT